MLYFSPGGETDFEKLQLRRKDGVVIVTESPWDDRYCSLVVPDVKQAYVQLCSHIRDRFPAQCVMVIGGSGKTAARTLVHEVLRQKYTAITHPDGPNLQSAAAAYEKARSFGTRVVAIADLRFALAMEGADVLLTTQTCEDRPRRVSAENALEHQALAAIRPGDTVLLCGMRDADLSTTARRLFGITDGVITDIW